jgi:hypothetical protein
MAIMPATTSEVQMQNFITENETTIGAYQESNSWQNNINAMAERSIYSNC